MNNRIKTITSSMTLLLSMALLTACATTTPHGMITASNAGEQSLDIDCSGVHNSYEGCYKVAAEMCPDGYKVISHQWLMNSGEFLVSAIPAAKAQLRGINVVCQGKMNKAKVFWTQELDEMGGA